VDAVCVDWESVAMKVGDLVRHRDDPSMQRGPGLVTKVSVKNRVECVDVYWTGQQKTICLYMPSELRAFDESR